VKDETMKKIIAFSWEKNCTQWYPNNSFKLGLQTITQ